MSIILRGVTGGSGGGGVPGVPSGPAGGSLAGTYPDPTLGTGVVDTTQFVDDSVTAAKLDDTDLVALGATIGLRTLIQTITVGAGGLATVDFQNIPQTFQHLEVWVVAQSEAATNVSHFARFNNDSGGNYEWQQLLGSVSTASGAGASGASAMRVGELTATGDDQGTCTIVHVPFYAAANRKAALSVCGAFWNGAKQAEASSGLWLNTAAVTRVTFSGGSGDVKQGSIYKLYGLP